MYAQKYVPFSFITSRSSTYLCTALLRHDIRLLEQMQKLESLEYGE